MNENSFSPNYYQTDYEAPVVKVQAGKEPVRPTAVKALYNDGGEAQIKVKWNTDNKIPTPDGGYELMGSIECDAYPNPFIMERADPYVIKHDGKYYFTASYPAFGSVEKGYDRIILRQADTLLGLACAEEKTIWKAHESGVMARHIWAPEVHYILDKWYCFFAAGEKDEIWNIRPFVLVCDGDPMTDEWKELGKMQASDGDDVSFNSFSLDMTYFENKGKHYVIWAEIIGDSSLFMAEIDPREPNKLISKPILLTKPEYDWEKVVFRVNEGASVLKYDGKIFVFFSASGTGSEYCMGVIYANEDSNLMDIGSWTKVSFPVLQTSDLEDQSGPGHNSFTIDDNGNTVIVYHARPASHLEGKCGSICDDSLYDPCRHARIKRVYFTKDGAPIIRMKDTDWVKPELSEVKCKIEVDG